MNPPKVFVVTGASAGVGRAVVRELAAPGRAIALLARGTSGLEEARREVEDRGATALAISTDVADPAAVEAAAERVERELGPIDVWVNDAMVTILAELPDIEAAEFRRVTEVTYLGTVHGTMSALKRMLSRGHGTVIQVGSALAYRGIPLQSAYCGAKHAIKGFTESVRSELIHRGSRVHVGMVHLPALNTPQFSWCRTRLPRQPQPVPPIFQPEVAARAIAWACFHRRRSILVGGPTVKTVLGEKVLPRFLDSYLARNGYDGQQTDEPLPADRPDNLFEPVPGDFGAHGLFDDRASPRSLQLPLTLHRGLVAAVALVLLAGAGALIWALA